MDHISRKKAEELFAYYSDYVFKTIFLLCKFKALAEDLTNETFIKISKKHQQYDSTKPIRPWIYKID